MEITPYIESIHRQLEASAQTGDEDVRVVVERLIPPLDASIRLALQDALSAAADEITVELAPGSVELRLRGPDPEFVVTPPPSDPPFDEAGEADPAPALTKVAPASEGEEGVVSRINLRLPEHLKGRIERAAGEEGLSVNAWLVRAAAAALERTDPPRRRERRSAYGTQRYTGWAR
jgi:HicB family